MSETKEKHWYNNALVWGAVLLILIAGIFYIAIKTHPPTKFKTLTYNNFDFVKAGGLWNTEWQKNDTIYHLRLRYNPFELENVSITGTYDPNFNRPEIYVAFDPTEGNFTTMALAATELSINMVQVIKAKPLAACTKNVTEVCEGRPIVTCGEANRSIILLTGKGEAGIGARGECLILLGEGLDLLKSVDRLLYVWYKIMPINND